MFTAGTIPHLKSTPISNSTKLLLSREMKVSLLVVVASTIGVTTRTARAFTASSSSSSSSPAARFFSSRPLHAEIRPPSTKNDILEYGWDGTTALGKAVVDSKPARLLDEIRACGEVQSEACQLFNANLGTCTVLLLSS